MPNLSWALFHGLYGGLITSQPLEVSGPLPGGMYERAHDTYYVWGFRLYCAGYNTVEVVRTAKWAIGRKTLLHSWAAITAERNNND